MDLLQLAQAEIGDVCGEADWLCQLVFRTTESELLARAATGAGVLLRILFLLLLAVVATMVARTAIRRFATRMERQIELRLERAEARGTLEVERYRLRRFQRLHAISGAMRQVAAVVIWLIVLFAILDLLGVALQPILAGAGLIGIIVGFGAQQLVRDVLAGIAMLIEDQYGVGDIVDAGEAVGVVEGVTLRSTRIRDVEGTLWHIPNGEIHRIGNMSKEWARALLDVSVAYGTDIDAAKKFYAAAFGWRVAVMAVGAYESVRAWTVIVWTPSRVVTVFCVSCAARARCLPLSNGSNVSSIFNPRRYSAKSPAVALNASRLRSCTYICAFLRSSAVTAPLLISVPIRPVSQLYGVNVTRKGVVARNRSEMP